MVRGLLYSKPNFWGEIMSVTLDLNSASLKGRVSEEEWQTRVDLAAAYRLASLYSWDTTLIYNHISARVPGTEDFLLNPFGLRWDEVTASNLVKVDMDGNILDDTSFIINQAGYVIHSAIHAAREDVGCVLHTHTEAGIAVSCLEDGLLFTSQDTMSFYGKTAYHDYEGIALDLDERERLVRDLGNNSVMILRNHGLLTTGKNVTQAWIRMYTLEKACSTQLKLLAAAAASGQKIRYLSREVSEHTSDQQNQDWFGVYEWPALIRQLDDVTTDYKK